MDPEVTYTSNPVTQAQENGITAARSDYNANREEGAPEYLTNDEYVKVRLNGLFNNYARNWGYL